MAAHADNAQLADVIEAACTRLRALDIDIGGGDAGPDDQDHHGEGNDTNGFQMPISTVIQMSSLDEANQQGRSATVGGLDDTAMANPCFKFNRTLMTDQQFQAHMRLVNPQLEFYSFSCST